MLIVIVITINTRRSLMIMQLNDVLHYCSKQVRSRAAALAHADARCPWRKESLSEDISSACCEPLSSPFRCIWYEQGIRMRVFWRQLFVNAAGILQEYNTVALTTRPVMHNFFTWFAHLLHKSLNEFPLRLWHTVDEQTQINILRRSFFHLLKFFIYQSVR